MNGMNSNSLQLMVHIAMPTDLTHSPYLNKDRESFWYICRNTVGQKNSRNFTPIVFSVTDLPPTTVTTKFGFFLESSSH